MKNKEIKINEFTCEKKKSIYKELCEKWKNNDLSFTVENTYHKGNYSKNSYQLSANNAKKSKEAILLLLKDIFDINSTRFDNKFNEACSGSGNEAKKICTIHSSSLCALLFFFDISKDNPLKLLLNGDTVIFDDVYFEYKNKVIKSPSNVDVVLIGKNQNSEDVVLFLESKFSEYFYPQRSYSISDSYLKDEQAKKYYESDFLSNIGIEIVCKKNGEHNIFTNKDGDKFKIKLKDNGINYLEGIKQIISHYIGVKNYFDSTKEKEDKRKLPNNAKVYLGTILFDFNFDKSKDSVLKTYSELYQKLAHELNNQNEEINVVSDVIKYSDLKDFIKNPKIKNFYF